MTSGILLQGFTTVYRESHIGSGMISQLLFGETFGILETIKDWMRISADGDGIEGWVLTSHWKSIEATEVPETTAMAIQPVTTVLDRDSGTRIIVPAGALWRTGPGAPLSIADSRFEAGSPEHWTHTRREADPEIIGTNLLSVPFLQGGRSGMGMDAPGLVQLIGKAMGLLLPRLSKDQAVNGTTVNFSAEVRKGDLAFFENEDGEIIHSGIALGEGRILHVHDHVRIDRLDHQGVYNTHLEKYTHHLRIIKRPVI